jgi:insulysin
MLLNQVEMLIIHDPDTDKAGAAMDVNVGNFSDDQDMQGMAHAVEYKPRVLFSLQEANFSRHLLMMGTKKYPVENDYQQYLSAHNGSYNGYTFATSTNYYFEVDTDALSGALDRFAQFFIEPLFLASTLGRELKAVDSEHRDNISDDSMRILQLQKSTSNPNHPWSYFNNGTFDVLKIAPEARGVNVRDKFMEFREGHYSANRMKLVILGREPLDVLEAWAAELFMDVPNKNLPQNSWKTELPLRPEDLLTQYFARPVMDWRWVDLEFPFLDETFLFESQPSRYLCHLIGHRGPGSIYSYLDSKGWVTRVYASMSSVCPGTQGLFICRIFLTEKGLQHYRDIVKVFFHYVLLLRDPPQEWIFTELETLADLAFNFKQKMAVSTLTTQTSAVMPRKWLLSGRSR